MVHIEADHVGHVYGQGPLARQVLDDINLDLTEQRVGVVGHNGSGKSTFVRMLNALHIPSEGAIRVNGLDTAKDPAKVRKLAGFLFTDPDTQIIMPTVAEDVAFGLRKSGLSKSEIAARVDELLVRFGLGEHRDHPAHLLSGGQKQLLALASVLITSPELIIMDEPTTLLDLRNARMIGQVIRELSQTVVLATHHLYLLDDFDRVLVFDGGRLVADGSPAESIAYYRELMDA
ncbi:ABC transporter ATP-binding protein [Propionimicrobium sp. PCR01-08-3]|uniref:energy-coupling factor ABC transporter ATP-binding protein n=1 Tax=Propionimicrobium sp. PCR01-08-3 TaxID=3052086 RepID=UPI00255CAA4D|nr:ABC transporter ATP-binding protein [Propionimicrobium sp. PCR01-08-3]WIY82349.1 ABC transporter ATP-binding protein [Propionimicrobium sp. PCR01-08-3]